MARAGYIILERDGFRCVYCGFSPMDGDEVVLSVDHIVPVALGGSDRADNLVACCESCNYQKQAKPLEPETRSRLIKAARERNTKFGIANGLIVDLGSTSAEKRARRRWQMLPLKAMVLAFNIASGADHSSSHRKGFSLAHSLCFIIDMLPEYARETGDIEGAERARQMLIDMMALVRRSMEGSPESDWSRAWSYRWVEMKLAEGLDDYVAERWMGDGFFEDWGDLFRRLGWMDSAKVTP